MTYSTDKAGPFGHFAFAPLRERIRRIGDLAGTGFAGRRIGSLARRIVIAGQAEPFDVEAAGGLRLRVRPSTNRCEKRAVSGLQTWDVVERAALKRHLKAHSGDGPFVFMDVGANVGLYSIDLALAARRLGQDTRLIAVEPDPQNAARLLENVSFNDVDIELHRVAIGEFAGRGVMTGGETNRGQVHFQPQNGAEAGAAQDAYETTEMISLAELANRAAVARVDALKVDIEGYDLPVLRGFFNEAPSELLPAIIIAELSDQRVETLALMEQAGYRQQVMAGINGIFERNA
ncbi:MAG: FkbM family methyltransferase [Pseudomonadota bacterium]